MIRAEVETLPATCSFCRKAFDDSDERIVHYDRDVVVGVYHEWCRPDRRRSGCGAAGCR